MPHPTIHAVCLASSGRALSGTCSGPAAFVNNRKKTSLHESILSGIKARFGALARYAAALDEKAAARLSAADHPQQAAKQLETLLRLPETGTFPGSTSSPLPSLWMKWRSLSTPSAG